MAAVLPDPACRGHTVRFISRLFLFPATTTPSTSSRICHPAPVHPIRTVALALRLPALCAGVSTRHFNLVKTPTCSLHGIPGKRQKCSGSKPQCDQCRTHNEECWWIDQKKRQGSSLVMEMKMVDANGYAEVLQRIICDHCRTDCRRPSDYYSASFHRSPTKFLEKYYSNMKGRMDPRIRLGLAHCLDPTTGHDSISTDSITSGNGRITAQMGHPGRVHNQVSQRQEPVPRPHRAAHATPSLLLARA
jgi:hypothetical protein